MKSRGSKRKRNKKSGHPRGRIIIINFLICAKDSRDGMALQMTLLFFLARPLRVLASRSAIACFHDHALEGCRPQPFHDRGVSRNSELWFIKVVCTLCVRTCSLDNFRDYLGTTLTPSIAFEVIRCLNPKLSLRFFEFSRLNLNLKHSFRTYNLLVRSLCQLGLHDSAKMVFDCMRGDGHLPDNSILGFLASSFAQAGNFDIAKGLLAQAQCDAAGVGSFVYNNLLNFLVKQNRVDEAICFFKEQLGSHLHPDTCTFNIVISGLCRMGEVNKAFEFFKDMESFGCFPDVITYNTLINGLCKVNEVDRGHGLLEEVQLKGDFSPDIRTYTSVISGYCKLGKMEEAFSLFNEMTGSGIRPNLITFNVLIDGFGKAGNMAAALSMYEKMLFLGCLPDVVTFTSLIDGYCRTGQVDQGLRLWLEMNARELSPNEYTFAILINALCKENRLQEAHDLLRHPKWKHIVPQPFMYNPVIDGFCKAGNVDQANVIVAEMEEKRCKPDKLTFTILIIGHCMKGRMSEAISIFNKMLAIGCAPDNITMSSLISCLLKAGMPNEASRIIQITSEDLNLGLSSSKRTIPLRTNMEIPVAV